MSERIAGGRRRRWNIKLRLLTVRSIWRTKCLRLHEYRLGTFDNSFSVIFFLFFFLLSFSATCSLERQISLLHWFAQFFWIGSDLDEVAARLDPGSNTTFLIDMSMSSEILILQTKFWAHNNFWWWHERSVRSYSLSCMFEHLKGNNWVRRAPKIFFLFASISRAR